MRDGWAIWTAACRHRVLRSLRNHQIMQGVRMVVAADRLQRLAVSVMPMIWPHTLALLAQALRRVIIGFYVTHSGVQTM